ncbi:MAG TPA: ROK family protein [Bryobacteraceae bacterium]|jgi:glucokinase|nr:ROK family protein [Bryobacteraceae bacterium]
MAPAECALENSAAVGIDVGGTKVLIHVVDAQGRLIGEDRRPSSRATGPRDLLALIEDAVDGARRVAPVGAVGVGFPGLTDVDRGVVLSSVILDGWRDVPLACLLGERLGIPCAVDNDVNNAARAELAQRGEDGRDMLFITVGSGVGGALVLAGKLWTGASGLAGEIGHIAVDTDGPRCLCGRIGCAGPRASGQAIAQRLADAANIDAWSIVGETAVLLGRAIASALNLLNLPLVVVGGGVADLGDRYLALIERAVRAEAFPEIAAACRIEPARAGYEAGATGAALLALQRSGMMA